jgi:hypothetical protein
VKYEQARREMELDLEQRRSRPLPVRPKPTEAEEGAVLPLLISILNYLRLKTET